MSTDSNNSCMFQNFKSDLTKGAYEYKFTMEELKLLESCTDISGWDGLRYCDLLSATDIPDINTENEIEYQQNQSKGLYSEYQPPAEPVSNDGTVTPVTNSQSMAVLREQSYNMTNNYQNYSRDYYDQGHNYYNYNNMPSNFYWYSNNNMQMQPYQNTEYSDYSSCHYNYSNFPR